MNFVQFTKFRWHNSQFLGLLDAFSMRYNVLYLLCRLARKLIPPQVFLQSPVKFRSLTLLDAANILMCMRVVLAQLHDIDRKI